MKKSMLSLLAVAAMVSCTQSDFDPAEVDPNKAEIRLSSTTTDISPLTRSPYEGAVSDQNMFTAKVFKAQATGGYSGSNITPNFFESGPITFSVADQATPKGFTTPLYYPAVSSALVYLCGLYPADDTWKLTGASPSVLATADIDGKTDLMATIDEAAPNMIKEVTSKKDDILSETKTYPNLTFGHLLTLVKIKAITSAADAHDAPSTKSILDIWGKIQKVTLTTLVGKKPDAQITALLKGAGGTIATKSGTSKLAFYEMTPDDTDLTKSVYTDKAFAYAGPSAGVEIPSFTSWPGDQAASAKFLTYSIVPPFTATGTADLVLEIQTVKQGPATPNTKPYTCTVGLAAQDMRGKFCTITLVFGAKGIQATATVTDWVDGGGVDGKIE